MLLALLFALTGAFAGQPALAQATPQEETTWERVQRTGSIRVGTVGTGEMSKVLLDGTFTGYSPEVLRAALARYGTIELVPVQMDFGSLIPALIADRIDVIANSMVIRASRCEQVDFGNPDYHARSALGVHKGNPKNLHSIADIAAREDAVLGFQQGGIESELADVAGVPRERILAFPDYVAAVAGLQTGRIDGLAMSRVLLAGAFRAVNDPNLEFAEPYHPPVNAEGRTVVDYMAAAFRKEDNDLREAYNLGLKELIETGALLELIQEQTGGDEGDMPPELTAEEICADAY